MRKIGKELKGGVREADGRRRRTEDRGGDFEFRIGEEIAHAKVAKGGKGEEKFGRRKAESEKEIRG